MSLFAYLAGSDKANKVRLGNMGLTERADGSQGFGGIIFDDPDKTLTVRGWMKVVVKETACTTAPVLFSGYVGPRKVTRTNGIATYKTGTGRFIDTTLVDENAVLDLRMFTANDAKRPAETEAARITWMLASSAMTGLIEDTTLVNDTDPVDFDEADYLYQYGSNVLEDLAAGVGKTFFVYVDGLTGNRGLFYDLPDATVGTCTLSLSNSLSDITFDANGDVTGTVYPTLMESGQDLDPSEVYSQIAFTYAKGTYLMSAPSTQTEFFTDSGVGNRGFHTENSRVGRERTALGFSRNFLAAHADEKETLTLATILPKEKAGLIRAGQRIQVKQVHMDGLETFTWRRIVERQIAHVDQSNEKYLVVIECHNRANGATGASGGAPGPDQFPTPPPPTSLHYYEGTMTFDDDNHAGGGGFGFAALPFTGTTTIACDNTNGAAFYPDVTYNGQVTVTYVGTISGVLWALDTTAVYPPNGGTIGIANSSTSWTGSFTVPHTTPAGTIGYFGIKAQPPDSQIVSVHWYFDPSDWVTPTAQPPMPGQPTGPETVTMTGALGTTTWPFADGSLKVFVDNLDETGAITAQDGAVGTFTLGFTPKTGEQVVVYYQGR